MNLYCYLCREAIERDEDIGGSVGFNYAVFPVCVKCTEEDR